MDVVVRASTRSSTSAAVFEDPFGMRRRTCDPLTGIDQELLIFSRAFAAHRRFADALAEQAVRRPPFVHPTIVPSRRVDRTDHGDEPRLVLVSDVAPGVRASALLAAARRHRAPIETRTALGLVRQLVAAIAALHASGPHASHRTLSVDRLVVTPDARLLVVESVLGPALEWLGYPPERRWCELALPAPAEVASRTAQRVDIFQVGVIALSLILGRRLRTEEVPSHLQQIVGSLTAVSAFGGVEPLPSGLRGWLCRALNLDRLHPFLSMAEAQRALERVLGETELVGPRANLAALFSQCQSEWPLAAGPSRAPR